jgi:hypothetical protein
MIPLKTSLFSHWTIPFSSVTNIRIRIRVILGSRILIRIILESPIRIRIRVKSRIRIRLKVKKTDPDPDQSKKFRSSVEAQNKAMKANLGALEANNGGAVGQWLQTASL